MSPPRAPLLRWAWPLAGVAAITAVLWLGREPLGRRLFPDAALAGELAAADGALGRRDAAAAARHYRAAAARDPDHPRVAQGLEATASLALAQAAAALQAGQDARATASLQLAEALGAPGDAVLALRHQLARQVEPQTEFLLQRAALAEATDGDAAAADYGRVLAREPGNAVAAAGLRRVHGAWLAEARSLLDAVALDAVMARQALGRIDAVRAVDPAHLDLPDSLNRLAEARRRAPALFADDPDAAVPRHAAGRDEATRWRGVAEEALGRGDLGRARRALEEATARDALAPELPLLRRRLADAEAARLNAGR